MRKETEIQSSRQISREISNRVWQACDAFRGIVDPAQYKDYILVILFLRYLSDRFAKNSESSDIVIPQESSFYALYEQRYSPNLGSLINQALSQMEIANPQYLSGIFCNVDFDSEINLGDKMNRNRRLSSLLENFYQIGINFKDNMSSSDIIGDVYIFLIERFASDAGKKAGEFYTPHTLAELVSLLACPVAGNSICDPTCGSGSLLLSVSRLLPAGECRLYGMEINYNTWVLARMNMFLHAVKDARIERCDTLNAPKLVVENKGKKSLLYFDRVVANPPFSLSQWGKETAQHDPFNRYRRGVPPSNRGDWAFISHMLEVAKAQTGRVVVIVPHGVLFRGGIEGKIRQAILKENLLDAVIALPGNLFPSTAIPVAILLFDRAREKGGSRESCEDVFFIDASHSFTDSLKKNVFDLKTVKQIKNLYDQRLAELKYTSLVSVKKILAFEGNLNVGLYIKKQDRDPFPDLLNAMEDIENIEKDLAKINLKIKKQLKHLVYFSDDREKGLNNPFQLQNFQREK